MDEIVRRKRAPIGEVEEDRYKGLRELLRIGCIDIGAGIAGGIAKGIEPNSKEQVVDVVLDDGTVRHLRYTGNSPLRYPRLITVIDSTARKVDEQGDSDG